MILIHQHMQHTFALRCEEIVSLAPPIAKIKERWPALFYEAQFYCEFHRITNQNLPFYFFAALDKYTPQLLLDKNNISAARTAALVGLPLYLKEDSSDVFKTCKGELEATQEGAVALVAVAEEEEVPAGIPIETHHVSAILEDQVVMFHRSTDALVILFGLMYALHINYPEKLSGFFDFIQNVLINLDDGRKQLKPKLQALKMS